MTTTLSLLLLLLSQIVYAQTTAELKPDNKVAMDSILKSYAGTPYRTSIKANGRNLQSVITLPTSQALLNQINLARNNPQAWASLIKTKYNNSLFGSPSDIEECIHYLSSVSPVSPLSENQGLNYAAQKHAGYLKSGWGYSPHIGCNGSTISQRVKEVGTWSSSLGENIAGGEMDPEAIIALWLIDSNVPTKGHRLNMMQSTYKVIGLGISSNGEQSYNPTIVAEFAGQFDCYNSCPQPAPFNKVYNCSSMQFEDDDEGYSKIIPAWSQVSVDVTQSFNVSLPNKTSILDAMNKVRTDPIGFAKVLSDKYNSSKYGSSDEIQNTINFLSNITPMAAFSEVQGLDAASQIQANYLRDNNISDPSIGCFNTSAQDRIKLAGRYTDLANENILRSNYSYPEEIVAIWIIDSGYQNTPHRNNLMNQNHSSVGIGLSSNQNITEWTSNIIIDFARDFVCNYPCPTVPQINAEFTCTQYIGFRCLANYSISNTISLLIILALIVSTIMV
jgi:uncharacterized protein YkwD